MNCCEATFLEWVIAIVIIIAVWEGLKKYAGPKISEIYHNWRARISSYRNRRKGR